MVDPVPDFEFKFWRTDTRSLVSALLLAVGMTGTMQIIERLDTIMWGGVIPAWGIMLTWPFLCGGGIMFGMTGAIIVAEFNPIVATLTATGPLAPLWFICNFLTSAPAALLTRYYKIHKRKEKLGLKEMFVIQLPIQGFTGFAALLAVWIFLFKFPMWMVIGLWLAAWLMGFLGSVISFFTTRSVIRSGVLT
jgi:hypothetical protein